VKFGLVCSINSSMSHNEDIHYQASFDSPAPPRFSTILKAGAAFLSGAGLGLVAVNLQSSGSAEYTNLLGGPTSLQHSPLTSMGKRAALASLPGGSWKNVALAAMEASQGCHRDISVRANPNVKAAIANMDGKSKAQLEKLDAFVQATARKTVARKTVRKGSGSDDGNEYGLPGVLPPLNWFDPAGFTTDIDKGKLLFYREAEIKHGRICMSASLGFLVAEKFHPLYGGAIDVPSVYAGKDPRLSAFWAAIFVASAGLEASTLQRGSWLWVGGDNTLNEDAEPGDVGYDPLGLLPSDPEELEEIQNKEILNGRFAMISLLGMVVEELVTGEKLHTDFLDGLR